MVPHLSVHLRKRSDIAAYAVAEMTVTGVDRPFRVAGAHVTPEIFSLLQTTPAVGRTFNRGEQNVVVLSKRLWRNRLGGRQEVLGEVVRLDGQVFTVVGVMSPGFGFPDAGELASPPCEIGHEGIGRIKTDSPHLCSPGQG